MFTFTGLGSRLARLRQGLPGFSRTRSETASTGAASQTGQAVTPAQAAAMALGRAIRQALPLGRPDVADLVARLEAGQAPLPGSVSDWIVQHLDPVLRQGLNAVVEAFGILPEQFEASRRRFSVPGFVVTSIRR